MQYYGGSVSEILDFTDPLQLFAVMASTAEAEEMSRRFIKNLGIEIANNLSKALGDKKTK